MLAPSEIATADEDTESCTVPLHGSLDAVAVGTLGDEGILTGCGAAVEGGTIGLGPAELMLATNPAALTLPSDVKASKAVLESTVTLVGACKPLKDCTRFASSALLPRYSLTKS